MPLYYQISEKILISLTNKLIIQYFVILVKYGVEREGKPPEATQQLNLTHAKVHAHDECHGFVIARWFHTPKQSIYLRLDPNQRIFYTTSTSGGAG
jgi:hypothetical protein